VVAVSVEEQPATEGGDRPPQSSTSRLPRSNSVKSSTAENPASEENRPYDESVADRAAECVAEFREEYPDLADLPLSHEHGQRLREELVDEEYVEESAGGITEMDDEFTVRRLDVAEPVTWADAIFEFLTTRQAYDDGLTGVFEDRYDGERFRVPFHDCWTSEYGDEQAAKNAGAQRQLMGGTYPENEDSARSGEHVAGEWEDVATIMLTRTGSSVPSDRRVPPVDHADAVARTWSNGGVYDVVRNAAEYHLGLDTEEWGYVRGDDVHGLDAENPGVNACYAHCHDAIYIDVGATDLRDEFDTDEEVRTAIESVFYPAIEKHVAECEYAKPDAHTREKAIDVRLDLEEPAGYATEYLRLNDDTPMMEMPPEMQAFAAIEWAQNRQRVARSQIFNQAADADRCRQDKDTAHGHRVTRNAAGEVVCAECGSPVGIEADTLTEHRTASDGPTVAADGGHSTVVGYRVGESLSAVEARQQAERLAAGDESATADEIMGRAMIDPRHRQVVEEVLGEADPPPEVEEVYGEGKPLPAQYELVEIVNPDGTTDEVSNVGGGATTVPLKLPARRLMQETRLRHVEDNHDSRESSRPYTAGPSAHGHRQYPVHMQCSKTGFATYEPWAMARHLAGEGIREPWHAEVVLEFSRPDGAIVPDVFADPVAEPPEDCL